VEEVGGARVLERATALREREQEAAATEKGKGKIEGTWPIPYLKLKVT
jgi:hypothetical protein